MRGDSSDNIRPPSSERSDHVTCFPFDVIVFAMLPAHGIWQPRSQGLPSLPPLVEETISLLDVM